MTHEDLLKKIQSEYEENKHFRDEPKHKPFVALRAVVELHKPKLIEGRVSNYLICAGCYEEEGSNYDYPCPTIQAIEAELG